MLGAIASVSLTSCFGGETEKKLWLLTRGWHELVAANIAESTHPS